ncbi:hypothetical protein ABZY31_30905 [Streptomyces sp. NPDC006529]
MGFGRQACSWAGGAADRRAAG